MPSKFKTPFLKLNKFIGTDKPKMDDFNSDNLLIDNIMKKQEEKLKGLFLHSKDNNKHITDKEREKWNSDLFEIGTYRGDGAKIRNINIGFKPRLVFVFKKDDLFITGSSNTMDIISEQKSAVITPLGSSKFCKITDNGFSVQNHQRVLKDTSLPKLNEAGSEYIYIMFR